MTELEGGCVVAVPLIFFGAMAAIVVAAVVWAHRRADAARHSVETVLAPFNVRMPADGWFANQEAAFEMDGVDCRLGWHPGTKNNPAYTQVDFSRRTPGVVRARNQGLFMGVRRFFGAQDVDLGDARFDDAFQVESVPVALARDVLTAPVREELLRWSPRVLLDVQRERVRLRVAEFLPVDEPRLRALVESARVIVRALATPASAEVEIVAVKTAGGDCPTCGAPLEPPVAACGKCGARQHADCWQYMGMCATYACGGSRKP